MRTPLLFRAIGFAIRMLALIVGYLLTLPLAWLCSFVSGDLIYFARFQADMQITMLQMKDEADALQREVDERED